MTSRLFRAATLFLGVIIFNSCGGDSLTAVSGRNLALTKTGVASTDGHTVTYTLSVSGTDGTTSPNGNPGQAGFVSIKCPVTLVDSLPPSATIVSASGLDWACTGGTCTENICNQGQNTFISANGGLPALTLVVHYPSQGPVTNCALFMNGSVTGAWAETSLADNRSCTTVTVPPEPVSTRDLEIQKTSVVSADGLSITYTMKVSGHNSSTDSVLTIECPDFYVTDSIPAGSTLLTGGNGIGPWQRSGSKYTHVVCLFAGVVSFPPSSVLNLVVVASVPPGKIITNCASVTDGLVQGMLPEPNTSNNRACVTDTVPFGALAVNAKVDGTTFTGPLSYTLNGPQNYSDTSVPQSYPSVPIGSYTISAVAPTGLTLLNVTPAATQTLAIGGSQTFTLNYTKAPPTNIVVNATLDGPTGRVAWSGPVVFALTGASNQNGTAAPQTFSSVSIGTYTLTWVSGGPTGNAPISISPGATQTASSNGTTTFTMNFR